MKALRKIVFTVARFLLEDEALRVGIFEKSLVVEVLRL